MITRKVIILSVHRRVKEMKTFRKMAAVIALIALVGCSGGGSTYKAGTYKGAAEGHNGDVSVEVTVSESAITAVKVVEHEETDGIADGALNTIPDAIVKANGVEVDTVSGCTDTSEAIIEAVKAALEKAKG